MFKKIMILFLCFYFLMSSICFAYTIKLKTITEETTYKDVYFYRLDDDYLRIYMNDGFDNIRIFIKKNFIISIEILDD